MNNKPSKWLHGEEEIKTPFNYKGCGLDDIWLLSGYDLEDIDGEETVAIRNLDGLQEAIAQSLVTRKKVLKGKEIRFLRLQLDLTQSELARLVGCDSQQIARYEKDENKMPGPAGRVLRMLVREYYGGNVSVRALLEALDGMDAKLEDKQVFSEMPDGRWKVTG